MSDCPVKPDCPAPAACLIQITDCHLPANPGTRLHGWDNWAALDAVLAEVAKNHPVLDGILLSGDLVHDESEAGYARLAARMQELDAPIYAIPGNHDNPDRLRTAFPSPPAEIGTSSWRLLALDSHIEDSDCGELGPSQLDALATDLNAAPDQPTLIAVHHPPVPVGSAWIDALGLRDAKEFLEVASQHRQIKAALCGHVHQASDTVSNAVRVLTTPAITRQFLPASTQYAEDACKAPGYRCLSLLADGSFLTHVHRVPAARAAGA